MGVRVERHHDGTMAKPFAYHFRILSCEQQERRTRVSECVRRDCRRQFRFLSYRLKISVRKILGVQRPSRGRGENKIERLIVWPQFQSSLRLPCLVAS